ncbi:MAG: murein transglycosylase, partial [Alphaproteobacteria bacterium]|nr:murein transglycosylase [Alphaproteobacteria bacterium]
MRTAAARAGWRWIALALALLTVACAPGRPSNIAAFQKTTFEALPGWTADTLEDAAVALRRSCERILAMPAERLLGPAVFGPAEAWRGACTALRSAGDGPSLRRRLEAEFMPVAVTDGDEPHGLFTGYFEPELQGARRPDTRFRTPIHAAPVDLVSVDLGQFREAWRGERVAGRVVDGRLRPYDTRAEIDAGSLGQRAAVLAWVDDPVDAFFLHIQGSGRIVLDDGGLLRVGFAAQNGHVYVPIGRVLVERGELAREQVSMQSIRRWLADNPDKATELLHRNPSYVFFRAIEGEGPLGSEGVALTPGRSLAVDRSRIALGVPVWL